MVMSSLVVASAPAARSDAATPRGFRANKVLRYVSSHVYLPACSIAVLAAILVAIGWSQHWGGAAFGGSLTKLQVILVGPLALVIIGVFMIIERIWPAQERPLLARGHRHDLILFAINATLIAPLVTALTLAFVEILRKSLPWIVLPKLGIVPRWGVIAVIVVAMDGCNWAAHFANHRVRMLWRFHELHHSQEDMNVLTVFRTHPLIHVSYLVALIPGVVLLANGAMSAAVLVCYGAVVAFAHSNTRLGFGPLHRIFVSPNYHRIHHKLDGPQDVNLGFALTIWDQLFHRAVFPTQETIRIDTGLPDRPLTVEQAGPRAQHLSVLAAQLVAPFRPMREPSPQPTVRDICAPPGLRRSGTQVIGAQPAQPSRRYAAMGQDR